MHAAPAVSCAKIWKKRTRAYRYRRGHPDIPCAVALRLISCSPRRRIRLATVTDGLKDCLNPVGSTRLRQLDTSNGCQDHTALPYAASPVVCTLCLLTDKPPCQHDHAPDAATSTASRPNVRDDGQRPSTGTGWRRCRGDLGARQVKFRKIGNIIVGGCRGWDKCALNSGQIRRDFEDWRDRAARRPVIVLHMLLCRVRSYWLSVTACVHVQLSFSRCVLPDGPAFPDYS